jgi:hypothetical protein
MKEEGLAGRLRRYTQRTQVESSMIEARDNIVKLGHLINEAVGDVQVAETKGVTPEEKLELLKTIEGIMTVTSNQVLELLDQKQIPKTNSGRIFDLMKQDKQGQ